MVGRENYTALKRDIFLAADFEPVPDSEVSPDNAVLQPVEKTDTFQEIEHTLLILTQKKEMEIQMDLRGMFFPD